MFFSSASNRASRRGLGLMIRGPLAMLRRGRACSARSSGSGKSVLRERYHPPLAMASGMTAGAAGSLVGMGGGFISIPFMTRFLGFTQHQAHGTSLLGVIGAGAAGSYAIWSAGESKDGSAVGNEIDPKVACIIAVAGMLTGPLGSKLTSRISGSNLKKMFGVFLFCVAPLVPAKPYLMRVVKDRESGEGQSSCDPERSLSAYAFLAAIGASTGVIAGLFGVGGGSIMTPMLGLTTDMSYPAVLGTSLMSMILPSLFAAGQHLRQRNVILSVGLPLMAGTATGAYLGGRYIVVNVDEMKLRWGFCGLMVVLGTNALLAPGWAARAIAAVLKR